MNQVVNNTMMPLSDGELFRRAPSIFTERQSAKLSGRYNFIPTSRVVNIIRSQGWYPVSADEKRVNLPENRGYQTHMIRFRDEESFFNPRMDTVPEIVLLNNHNGSGCYRLYAGIFRFICLNGLVVGDSLIPSVAIKHINTSEDDVIEATYKIVENLPKVLCSVSEMKRLCLPKRERRAIQEAAIQIRWPKQNDAPSLPKDIFLEPKRYEDKQKDLWTTLNVVQENAVNGFNYIEPETGRNRKLRKLTAIDKIVDVNTAIWEKAEHLLQRHMAA